MLSVTIVCQDSGFQQKLSRVFSNVKGGAEVLALTRLGEALDHHKTRKVGLLVVDWNVGKVPSHTSFLQQFRKIPGCRRAHVITLADAVTAQILAICTEYGVARVLQRDGAELGLATAVESLLEEQAQHSVARGFLGRIEAALEVQAYGELDRLAEDFVASQPDHPRAQLEFANLCLRRGRWDEARAAAQKVLARQPDNLRALSVCARTLLALRRLDEASAVLERAEILSPRNLDRLVMLGDMFRQTGQTHRARNAYQSALEVDEASKEAQKGLGLVELTEGHINEALSLFRDSSTEEEVGGFFNNAGVLAVKRSEYEKASHLYLAASRALSSNKLRAKVVFNLGLAYRKWNKPTPARACFEEALSLDRDFAKARKQLTLLTERSAGNMSMPSGQALQKPRSATSTPLTSAVTPTATAPAVVSPAVAASVAGAPAEQSLSSFPFDDDPWENISPDDLAESTNEVSNSPPRGSEKPEGTARESVAPQAKNKAPQRTHSFIDEEEDF